jgi:hypothetical protein
MSMLQHIVGKYKKWKTKSGQSLQLQAHAPI